MQILNTNHKRKSAIITSILLVLFVFAILNYGMTYLDPPEEYGLAINFGDAEVGKGEPVQETKKDPTPKVVEKEEVVEEVKEIPEEIIKEDIITDDTAKDISVVEKTKEVKKEPVEKIEKKEKVVPKPKPKPSKETTDALNSLLNGATSDGQQKGEGDDTKDGVKGTKNGDKNSKNYYGNTKEGSGGDYDLEGRTALKKPKKQPECQEEGIVVVEIIVDRNGKVIKATPGFKGSTNTNPCLLKPAKEAALQTTWNVDKNAPATQAGTIIYKFSLTK
ncbi:energy transducer TonB [Polaribacter sp. P097]|uniref:energy transducer TonB n=1 Tax=Polaribacter sp. P097 TaxID=3117398 RepID=UPI002FDFE691